MRKFLIFWMPVIFYAGFIFFISSLPSEELPTYFLYDKLVHLIEFAILGFLLTRAIRNYYPSLNSVKIFFLVVICVFFYGVSDELHQSFTPGRVAEFGDLFTDGLGGVVGNLVYLWRR